jgi:cbb3-type cytochrome oxidase subunit 3
MTADTIAGMIVMGLFVLWVIYLFWPRKKEPEDPDEFDIEQIL